MSLLHLILLSSVAQSFNFQLTNTIFHNNQEGFRDFITSIFTQYTGLKYTPSSDCMNPTVTQRLQTQVLSVITKGLNLNTMEFLSQFEKFITDLSQTFTSQFADAKPIFEKALQKNSQLRLLVAFRTNTKKIQEHLTESLFELNSQNWTKAGVNMGKLIEQMLPDGSSSLFANAQNFYWLTIGVLKGLQKEGVQKGACMSFFDQISSKFGELQKDLTALLSGNFFKAVSIMTSYQAAMESLTAYKVDDCNLIELGAVFDKLQGMGGISMVSMNYATNTGKIGENMNIVLEKCSADYKKCGMAIGESIRILLNWSVN